MQEMWNRFVFDLCEAKTKDSDEDNYHALIETQIQLLGWADVTGKLLSYVKYSSKRSGFFGFFYYLCHVIDDFCLSCIAALR